MKRHVYSHDGLTLLRVEEANPVCGDHCDACGDCLYCYGENPCLDSKDGQHFWVVYEDEIVEASDE